MYKSNVSIYENLRNLRKGEILMTKRNKRMSMAIAVLVTVLIIPSVSNAASAKEGSTSSVAINCKDVEVSKNEQKQYLQYQKGLVEQLKAADTEDYSEVIAKYSKNKNYSAVKEIEKEIAKKINGNVKNKGVPEVKFANDFDKKYNNTYTIDGKTKVTITPLYIEVESDLVDNNTKVNALQKPVHHIMKSATRAKKTRHYSKSKKYYNSFGRTLFEVGMECDFYYNYLKAWYKGGFNAWYKRGAFSFWQVDNWNTGREKSGETYQIHCSGNFHFGLEVHGVGIVAQEVVVRQVATCHPSGNCYLNATVK